MKILPCGNGECPRCQKILPLDCFGSNQSTRNGKNCYCKACVRAISESRKGYYKKWCSENRAKINANGQKWRSENTDLRKEVVKKSYLKHREKTLQWKREYYQRNKDKWRTVWLSSMNVRRAIKARYLARLAAAEKIPYRRRDIFARDNRTCIYCNAPAQCLDHVVPLSKGGSDTPFNVVACCHTCNGEKGFKLLGEWTPPKWRAEFHETEHPIP